MPRWKCTVKGNLPAGDIWITGINVFNASSGTTADVAAAWATAWDIFWNGLATVNAYKTLCKTTLTAIELNVTQINDRNKNVDQVITTIAYAGTATDDSMPGETCPVLSLRTSNASKAGRGRMYLPAVTEASNAGNGVLVGASQTLIAHAGQNLVQSMNGASFEVQVWHTNDNSGDGVTAVDVANVFRVQRRRQNKVDVTRSRMSV